MNVVLVNPEIPQNTGNIARTCAATGATLHLIKPLGFELSDRYLKRAGLDYWRLAHVCVHDDWRAFRAAHPSARLLMLTTKARVCYADVAYRPDDCLVFGRETRGLPEDLLRACPDACVRIPMLSEARSLNLANSVAVVLYEALRQQGFPGLSAEGGAHGNATGAWRDWHEPIV